MLAAIEVYWHSESEGSFHAGGNREMPLLGTWVVARPTRR